MIRDRRIRPLPFIAAVIFLTVLPGMRAGAQMNPALELFSHGAAHELTLAQQEAGNGPVKCGFGAVLAALSEMGRAASESVLDRPAIYLAESWTSPGGGFVLHYTRAGYDSIPSADTLATGITGIPDYIEYAAATLDSVHTWYTSRGWRSPVNDGDGRYDVYFMDLEGPGYFGYTAPVEPYTISPPYTAASYIVLENDYPPWYGLPQLAALRVTIAHEYAHAIQLSYNNSLFTGSWQRYIWFAEASAVYHEEQIYDGINDYVNYISYFLDKPYLALTESGSSNFNHTYGAVVWTLMLDALFGPEAVRDIWTLMATEPADAIAAHRLYLADEGTDLLETYATFTEWMLHTGSRDDPQNYYEEGASFPQVMIEAQIVSDVEVSLPGLATRYYRSAAASGAGGVAIAAYPSQQAEWGVGIVGADYGGNLGAPTLRFRVDSAPEEGIGLELFDQANWDAIIRWSFTGDNYSVSTGSPLNRTALFKAVGSDRLVSAAVAGSPFELHQNYPNPYRPANGEQMHFAFDLPAGGNVTIEIRSVSGGPIWSHTFTGLPAGPCFTDDLDTGWDGRDENGNAVASGVYLLVATHGETTRALQFSVIR